MSVLLFPLLLFLFIFNCCCRCAYSSGSFVCLYVVVFFCYLCCSLWENCFSVVRMARSDGFWTCLGSLNVSVLLGVFPVDFLFVSLFFGKNTRMFSCLNSGSSSVAFYAASVYFFLLFY